MFETGEYVVYGRTGICQVTGVTTMKMDGSSSERLYYVLRPGGETEGKIFTPVEGGKQVLRGIITKEAAEKLIDEIPSIETLAEDHLYSEFSMLLDIPKEHMAGYIEQRVHQHREEEQACAV